MTYNGPGGTVFIGEYRAALHARPGPFGKRTVTIRGKTWSGSSDGSLLWRQFPDGVVVEIRDGRPSAQEASSWQVP